MEENDTIAVEMKKLYEMHMERMAWESWIEKDKRFQHWNVLTCQVCKFRNVSKEAVINFCTLIVALILVSFHKNDIGTVQYSTVEVFQELEDPKARFICIVILGMVYCIYGVMHLSNQSFRQITENTIRLVTVLVILFLSKMQIEFLFIWIIGCDVIAFILSKITYKMHSISLKAFLQEKENSNIERQASDERTESFGTGHQPDK